MATIRLLLESGDVLLGEDGTSAFLTESSLEGSGEQFSHWVGSPGSQPYNLLAEDGTRLGLEDASGAIGGETPGGGLPYAILRLPTRTASDLLLETGDRLLGEDGASFLQLEVSPEGFGEQFSHWVGSPASAPFTLLAEDGTRLGLEDATGAVAGEVPGGGRPLVAVALPSAFTGTATLTTAGLSVAATAAEAFTSTAALTLAGLSVAATDAEVFTGTAALTTAGLSVAATATEVLTGTAALTTAGLSVAATATETFAATAALTTAGLSVSATDAESFAASADLTTAGLSVAVTAAERFDATAALTTAGLSVAATDVESFDGTAALTTAGLSVGAAATESFDATAALTTAGLSVAATDAEVFTSTVGLTVAGLSVDATVTNTTPVVEPEPPPSSGGGGGSFPVHRPEAHRPREVPRPVPAVRLQAHATVAGLGCAVTASMVPPPRATTATLVLAGLSAAGDATYYEEADPAELAGLLLELV